MKKLIIAAMVIVSSTVLAAEPTLNDLPEILSNLRGCAEKKTSFFSTGTTTVCAITENELWVAIHSDGKLTLFRQRRSADSIYARGNSISELLKDFNVKLNAERETNKIMLDALGQYLPSQ